MTPRLLDLFCGAGGAAVGYHRAGFDVVGVDIVPQPHYPFRFHQMDAMWLLDAIVNKSDPYRSVVGHFDTIHASPPCHDHSTATGRAHKERGGTYGTGWMLAAVIDQLRLLHVPWIVENVGTARFPADVYTFRLCGSSFGLDVQRHRRFASPLLLMSTPCHHAAQAPRFVSLDGKRPRGYLARVVGVHGHTNYAGEGALREQAMGIDWMSPYELTQAIPPAYTEHIGHQLVAHLEAVA